MMSRFLDFFGISTTQNPRNWIEAVTVYNNNCTVSDT